MKAIIGVSNRHVHLNKEDFNILFGNQNLDIYKNMKQTNEYASTLKVSIKTDKKTIENVRVMGPLRNYTQVEISKTDSYSLGIDPPIRDSGDLTGAEVITIIGPLGEIKKPCCIIPTRHLHISPEERNKFNLIGIDSVTIYIGNNKTSFLENVRIKETPNGVLEIHLDTDDANSNFIKTGDYGVIISSNTTSSPVGSVPFK